MYLIARLNLAINEESDKFWHGVNDKASMGEYAKELGGEWGSLENLGSMDGGGIGEFLVV